MDALSGTIIFAYDVIRDNLAFSDWSKLAEKSRSRENPRSPIDAHEIYQTVYRRFASHGSRGNLIDRAGHQTSID